MAEDDRKVANRERRTRRARKEYDDAGRLLKTPSLPTGAKVNLNTARNLAALAVFLGENGHDEDAAGSLEISARSRTAAVNEILKPVVEHGEKFGPKPRQLGALSHAIDATLLELGDVSAEEVLRHIKKDGGGPILKIVDNGIYWRRTNGQEAKTTVRSFDNLVSNSRKRVFGS